MGDKQSAIDVDVILFDLDNTLYHPRCGLLEAGDLTITRFIADRLGLTAEEADQLRVRTWQEYGTTARGLEMEFGIPQCEFFDGSIELLQVEDYLEPEPELAAMLDRLPQLLYIFTNAPERYARRAVEALGIAQEIDGIFHVEIAGGSPKPECECYDLVVEMLGVEPERIAMIEDTEANLEPAAELGMVTVKLGPPPPKQPHHYLRRLEDLPELLGL